MFDLKTSIEEQLITIWSEVLNLNSTKTSIDSHTNFFQMGGSSLQASEIIIRIEEVFNVELALSTVFEAPTIAGLIGHIEQAIAQGKSLDLPPVEVSMLSQILPFSGVQESSWLLTHLMPSLPLHHMSVTVRIPHPVNPLALERALNEIIRRHQAWRSTFDRINGEYTQTIQANLPIKLRVIDLSGVLDREDREQEAKTLATEEAIQPFDLAAGPLIRTRLIQLAPDDQRLYLTVHHLIFDRVSLEKIFLPELQALYFAFSDNKPSPLPEPLLQYGHYVLWHNTVFAGQRLVHLVTFWKTRLRGLPEFSFSNRTKPGSPTFRGARWSIYIEEPLTQQLRQFASQHNSTLFLVLLTTFNLLFYHRTAQRDFGMFIPVSGRHKPNLEKVMGSMAGTILIRSQIAPDQSLADLLDQIRNSVLEAYAHQGVSMFRLLRILRTVASHGQHGQENINFAFNPLNPPLAHGWIVSSDLDLGVSIFDLSFELTEQPAYIVCVFQYSLDIFDPDTIAELGQQFLVLLTTVLSVHPSTTIDVIDQGLA
jgi:acyl carrier protein